MHSYIWAAAQVVILTGFLLLVVLFVWCAVMWLWLAAKERAERRRRQHDVAKAALTPDALPQRRRPPWDIEQLDMTEDERRAEVAWMRQWIGQFPPVSPGRDS